LVVVFVANTKRCMHSTLKLQCRGNKQLMTKEKRWRGCTRNDQSLLNILAYNLLGSATHKSKQSLSQHKVNHVFPIEIIREQSTMYTIKRCWLPTIFQTPTLFKLIKIVVNHKPLPMFWFHSNYIKSTRTNLLN
jgi:hypothetical protein